MYIKLIKNKYEYNFGGRGQEVDRTRREMTICGDVIRKIENFRYLGSYVQNNGGFNE